MHAPPSAASRVRPIRSQRLLGPNSELKHVTKVEQAWIGLARAGDKAKALEGVPGWRIRSID